MASIEYRNGRPVGVRAYGGVDPVTKKTRRLYEPLPPDAAEEDIELALARIQRLADLSKHVGHDADFATMVAFYIDFLEANGAAPGTLSSYRSNLRCYIEPICGDEPLRKIDTFAITSLYTEMLTEGGKDRNPVSPNTVLKLHSWLKGAFEFFIANGFATSNPLPGVKLPLHVDNDIEAMSIDDYTALLDYLTERIESGKATTLDHAVYFDMGTGLRAGELSALKIKDFSSKKSQVFIKKSLSENPKKSGRKRIKKRLVYQPPKSKKTRKVSIDKKRTETLENHLEIQREKLAKKGIKQTVNTPLFCRSDGKPYRPRTFNDHLKRITKKLKLNPRTHLHSLRHTHATALLEGGTNIIAIKDRLGHYDVSVTLKNYGHILRDDDARTASDFAGFEEGLISEKD